MFLVIIALVLLHCFLVFIGGPSKPHKVIKKIPAASRAGGGAEEDNVSTENKVILE